MSYLSRDDIKIHIKLFNSGNLLARATVTLFDCWEEHGWRVMKSQKMHPRFGEEIWIQAPCYKSIRGWEEMVFITDRKTWDLVHEMIYDKFFIERNKKEGFENLQTESKNPTNEEVNPDEIPL